LLIDSTHRRWIVAALALTAAALAVYLAARFLLGPERTTGGSPIGLIYGAIGSGLMVYAGLLSAHRFRRPRRKSWPRQTWLRGHIWLGLVSGVFLWCHSGFRWGGLLEFWLWIAVLGVLITGVVGVVLQAVLPRWMMTRVAVEAPYEQIPHLCQVMRRRADALVDGVCGPYDPVSFIENTRDAARVAEDGKIQLRLFYERDIRPFLAARPPHRSPLLNPIQTRTRFDKVRDLGGLEEHKDKVGELADLCDERRALLDQERIHFWLHSWLLLHIPLSLAVLVVGAVHAVTALFY
jgi:hypothetical protein